MSELIKDFGRLSPAKQKLLLRRLKGQSEKAGREAGGVIPVSPRRQGVKDPLFPLSFAQQRLWFLAQLEPGLPNYHIPTALRLTGPLRVAVLERTLAEVVRRHEALRTTFVIVNDEPFQRVLPRRDDWRLPQADLSGLPDDLREAEARRLATQEARRPFDIENGPHLRATLLRLQADGSEHALLFTLHHIVSDGWSMGVLVEEVKTLYDAYAAGQASPLPDIEVQYPDFADWQRGWLTGEVLDRQVDYWKERLAGIPAALDLPADHPRPPVQSFRGGHLGMRYSRELLDDLQRLRSVREREGDTLFMTLLAAFGALLGRYTGQDDIPVGSPIANRNRYELEGLIGFFVNTLVLRVELGGDPTFREIQGRVREATLGAYAHQDLPFEKLVEELRPERDLSRTPLFQVMFILQNTAPRNVGMGGTGGTEGTDEAAELGLAPLEFSDPTSKFDLTASASETPAGLLVGLEYASDLFDEATARRMLGHFGVLLAGVVADPDRRLSQLPLLTSAEERELLVEDQTTRAAIPALPVHEQIARMAAQRPDAAAVRCGAAVLSYRELNERANRLGWHLRRLGVGPESKVGVCLERSPGLLVALLGVLKAGGAYVPLDPSHPADRLGHALEDARVAVILTEPEVRNHLPLGAVATTTTLEMAEIPADLPGMDLPSLATGENLAYTLYTSGSTGRPKGVEVRHRGLVNLLASMARQPGFPAGGALVAVTTVSFDIAGLELYLPLLAGGRVELATRDAAADAGALAALIQESAAAVMQATPATWRMLLDAGWEGAPALTALCGGEALPAELAERLLPRVGALWNVYGPTETTIWSTVHAVKPGGDGRAVVPIGRPIANTTLYLLDRRGPEPVPSGVAGELYLGGEGLARGYAGRPDLTAERFVPDPFREGGRLYRTGDLARRLTGGAIEFLGRADHQVKIRGFRIELGEIEAALLQQEWVGEAAVVAREVAPGDVRLVAYLTGEDGHVAPPSALRTALREILPDYMIPTTWVILPEMPRTPNGKLDRKALPAPEGTGTGQGFVAPRNPTEELLAEIWSEVLEREPIGVHDDFFDLGGHSLLATRVFSRIRQTFGVDLRLREVFELPTVALLARRIEGTRAAAEPLPLVPVSRDAVLPLSFGQQRLWFLSQLEPDRPVYNMFIPLRLRGPLDVGCLERAIGAVVRRHEALRTFFPAFKGEPLQVILPDPLGEPQRIDLTPLPAGAREPELMRLAAAESLLPFDLEVGPLLRTTIVQLDPEGRDHALLLTVHHSVADGWSLGLLVQEVTAFYAGFATGLDGPLPPLPPLPIQYADFAVWQRAFLQGETLEEQLGYWRRALEGAPALLELPTDRPRPAVLGSAGDVVSFGLGAEALAGVRALGRRHGATLYMTLLAAFATLLHRHGGGDDVLVGSPIANRNRPEIEGLIGYFANTLVLRTRLDGDPAFADVLARVREASLGAYAHQDIPFEKLVEELRPERSLAFTPLFQVMLVLQNVPSPEASFSDLRLESLSGAGSRTANFDLSLTVTEDADRIFGTLTYRTDLFDASIRRMVGGLIRLLVGAATDSSRPVSELPMLGKTEVHQALEWNDTWAPLPASTAGLALHQLFEAQAARTPDRIALSAGSESLTYAELDRRATTLAGHIQGRLGSLAERERIVAICAPRNANLLVGILAALKAGAAYLPLDPGYPRERLAFMLEDAAADLLLTEESVAAALPDLALPRLDLGAVPDVPPVLPVLPPPQDPGRLAYLIYTSGSTGRPKGVAIEHRSAVTLVEWARGAFSPAELEAVLASTSVCFDLSIFELFLPLAVGGRVVLVQDALALVDLPESAGVTLINTVPSALDALLRSRGLPATVRTVNLAGEPIPRELVNRVEALPNVTRMLNLYGPSEDTTYSTWASLLDDPATGRPVPIGRPVAGTRAHLLDAGFRPVPGGVPGHLHLGGAGLARGYFGRPELTAERFVPDPFSDFAGHRPGDRLYRTGDLARRRSDGTLEFLGRIDHQVKVRGFRIELGEIEDALARHPALREAAAAVREINPGDRRLVAFVAPAVAEGAALDPQARAALITSLRAALQQTLPDAMIPSVWSVVPALPRNANGKLDRKALPEVSPEGERAAAAGAGAAWAPPRNEAERAIAEIWKDVLGIEKVGTRDNFFDLGGHSLLLVQVHERLRQGIAPSLPLVDLFRFPDVASLARHIAGDTAESPARPAVAARPAPAASQDIAIVGLAGRFPRSPDLETFWQNLRDGVECTTFFSREELLAAGVAPAQLDNPAYVPARGVFDGVDLFDAGFFDVNPREAQLTDPQHRLFLEIAELALENAGYASGGDGRDGGRVGVFAGAGLSTYAVNNLFFNPDVPAWTGGLALLVGNEKDFVATRVSYKLNLRGPAMTVQTACSTSLTAVHTACRSLLAGECDMALAGGVSVRFPQKGGYLWQEGGINSPDGHTRAFDANAKGTLVGDGAGVVVLKPLAAALADGDTVHAVIRGTAINNDGSGKVGFTAPSVEGQARAIAEAQAHAGVAPETIQYVECHGTATPLGDPIEVTALNQAFGRAGGPRTCAIGSVKTNVGHLDAAAGITGLIKTVLALQHGEIPPSLHFEKPNPQIDFAAGPFYVNTALSPWPDTGGGPRRAGVSSFGLGGTNVHVVLEEAPRREPELETPEEAPLQLLVLSARSEPALERATDDLAAHLLAEPDRSIGDVAWTLQAGRRALDYRRAVVARGAGDAREALAGRDPRRVMTGLRAAGERPVAFLFSGLGEQYPGMGRELYRTEPVFRAEVDRSADLLHPYLGMDVRTALFPEKTAENAAPAGGLDLRRMLGKGPSRAEGELARTAVAQPALFVLEYALAKLWMSWGIVPQAVIGYSLGEYVAACVAGVLSLGDALVLVAERARFIDELPAGAMLAVALPEAELLPHLAGGELSVAAVTGPRLCVAAGPPEAVADLERRLAGQEIPARRVETSHAFHSRMMLPAVDRLTALAASIERRAPRIPCLSNVTGTWMTPELLADPGYWARHMSETVRLADGLAELWRDPARVLLEIGPGSSLTSLALQHPGSAGSAEHMAVPSLPSAFERQGDREALLHSLAKLWIAGVPVDWRGHHGEAKPRRIPLPAYPFERQRFWIEPSRVAGTGGAPAERWQPVGPLPPLAPGELSDDLDKIAARWLVLAPGSHGKPSGLAARVVKRLLQEGLDVTVATPGDGFSRSDDKAYEVSPGRRGDWATLFNDQGDGAPRRVLHLWGLPGPESTDTFTKLERAQEFASSLLPLLRELGERSSQTGGEVRLLVAADRLFRLNASDTVPLEKAAVRDTFTAAAERYPALRCRAVDVRPPAEKREAWEKDLVDRLLAELARGLDEPFAAYAGQERWGIAAAPAAAPVFTEPADSGATALVTAPADAASLHARPNLRNAYVAPDGELEKALAASWQELLGIASVGRHDSFFEMGGHSLLATQLMNRIRKTFGVSLPMASLFAAPTVAELAAVVERSRSEGGVGGLAGGEEGVPLPVVMPDPAHRFEPFPLTDIQQAYWLGRGAAFELGNIGAHIYWELDWTGLDLARMNHALRRTIDRHEMLRAVFLPDGRQKILADVPPYNIATIDLTGLGEGETQVQLERVRHQMSHQVLNPERWPLFEMRAARIDERRTRIFLSIDVLIGDGYSFGLIGADLARFYAFPDAVVPPFELSFRDYVLAEAALQETEAFARSLAYWQDRLAALPGAPELPMAKPPASLESPRFRRWTARLQADLWKRLKERGTRIGLTPSGLLLAAFSEILAAWSKSPRFTITLTLFNRLPVHREVDQIVGDFTSLTLLGVDMSGGGGFEGRARQVQERLWQDLEHRVVSGVRVLREMARIQGRQSAGAMPVVFTSAINVTGDSPAGAESPPAETAAAAEEAAGALSVIDGQDFQGPSSEQVFAISQTPQVWLDHQITEVGGALNFNWDVVEELFPAGLIDDMFGAYKELLHRLATDEGSWTSEQRRLIPASHLARRVTVNATGAPLSHEYLHTLFEHTAARQPDRPAVIAPGRTLTYAELSRHANRLGRRLRDLGVRPNTLVAVVMEKSWEQVVAVLAIQAAGAAYLPIEAGLPKERLYHLLDRGEVQIALTQSWIEERIAWPAGLGRVAVDRAVDGEYLNGIDATPLKPVQAVTDLAYVIFTSGSTGQPKGVMIDHRGAVNTILDCNERFDVGPDDRALAVSSLSFDLSVYDIFGMLAAGGAVVFPRIDAARDPAHWTERVAVEKVTIWNTVPALMKLLVDHFETAGFGGQGISTPLRLVMMSGDWIPLDLPDRIRRIAGDGIEIFSLGGATEASIWSILFPVGELDPAWKSIPYGKPMVNQTFHVLDERLEPRPDWVPGSLFIGGHGLAKGYWRDADKTAASFLVHPATGERLYRTGDLGRYFPDGNIEFLGREDFQVKIQGYRIELGEIEAVLGEHPRVRAAVVTAVGEQMGNKRLVGYVVPVADAEGVVAVDAEILKEELRAHLRARLPEYMVPAVFVTLTALPLGANGKVDRRALPAPEQALLEAGRDFVEPRTDTERGLARIWSELLRVERIGAQDNFYELGGDSLLATQVMSRVREAFRIELPLQTFFEAPTLESLAEAVDRTPSAASPETDALADLVQQLQDISPEEVERMLAELRSQEEGGSL